MKKPNRRKPLYQKWFDRMEECGIKKRKFEPRKKKLTKKLGIEPNDRDVAWSLFNERIGKLKDYHQLKMLYFNMALFLNEEGREYFRLLQTSREMELRKYQSEGIIEKVEVLNCGTSSCEACQKQGGRILTIQEALETMPVPNRECTFVLENGKPGFCRCSYIAVID